MLPVCLALLGIQEGIQTRVADRLTHERGWTQERKQTHEVDWLTHHHNQEGTPAHKVEWLAFEHSLTQDGTYSRGQNKVYISFLFYGRSTARNVPFHFYRIFRSYVEIIADSAINGFECDEQFLTLHVFAHEQAIDAE